MTLETNEGLIQAVLTAAATEVICCKCRVSEFVLPLDEGKGPFEQAFLENYICSECE